MSNIYSNAVSCATAIPAHLLSSQPVAVPAPQLGKPIAYYARFARIAGGAREGLFLSQLWYWTQRMMAKHGDGFDGWIWKDADEWQDETGLTRAEQKTARKHLEKRGLLTTSKKGRVHGTLQFRLNTPVLFCLLADIAEIDKAQKQKCERSSSKCQKHIGENAKDITENTQKNSQKLQQHTVAVDFSQNESVCACACDQTALIERIVAEGVTGFIARELVTTNPAALIEKQLAALDARKPRSRAATLVKSIRQDWSVPDVPRAPQTPVPRPAISDAEKARLRVEELAGQKMDEGIAHRIFLRLDSKRQAFVTRCIELEKNTLLKVIEREENYAFIKEKRQHQQRMQ